MKTSERTLTKYLNELKATKCAPVPFGRIEDVISYAKTKGIMLCGGAYFYGGNDLDSPTAQYLYID